MPIILLDRSRQSSANAPLWFARQHNREIHGSVKTAEIRIRGGGARENEAVIAKGPEAKENNDPLAARATRETRNKTVDGRIAHIL